MNSPIHGKAIGVFLVVCVLVGTAVLTAGASPAAPAPQAPQSAGGGQPVFLMYDPTPSTWDAPPPQQFLLLRVQTATINVNYLSSGTLDGYPCSPWPSAAQTAFEYAAGIWESLIASSVPIEINACWSSFSDPNILGGSRAVDYYANFPGSPVADTWYPLTLANALYGADLAPTDADINIIYNKDRADWYFGVDGHPGGTEIDFASVVLHEICHGLGFAGSMVKSGSLGYWEWGTGGYPAAYDRFTEQGGGGSGTPLLSYGNGSTALGSALTSQNVYFDGTNANAANGGTPPKLYAPSTWQQGSSYSHLDYATYNDTVNELMVWAISSGEAVHDPGPVANGILQDVGWTMGGATPDVGVEKQVTGGSDLEPGDPITFTLAIGNSGTLTTTNTVVTDTIPSEVLTPTFTSTLAVTPTGVISYVWEVEPLEPGQSGVITICGWISPSLESDFSFVNTATISDPEDTTPGNNTSSVMVGERTIYLPLVLKDYPPILTEDFDAVADTFVRQGAPTVNFGSATDMWVGYDHCSGGQVARSLVRFDVSSIPAGAVIEAKLYLLLVDSCDIGERTHTATVYRVSSDWSSSSVTWNTKPGYAEAYGSASIPSRTWGWYSFDATGLVQGWVDGSFPNYGLMVRGPESSGSSSARLGFATLNSGATYAPYLEITYYGDGAFGLGGDARAIGEALAPGRCWSAVADSIDIDVFELPGDGSFEAVRIAPCSPGE